MKFTASILFTFAVLSVGCGDKAGNQPASGAVPSPTVMQGPMSPASRNQPAPQAGTEGAKSKWKQTGTPIDAAKVDADIAKAEKAFNAAKGDSAKKKALADAYFARAELLRDNAQYAAALGDYRRTAKLDATNSKVQERIDEIVRIYASMNREHPPEGQEPEALRK